MQEFYKKKVVIAISGGVDSSVSAWLLKNYGYYVEGLFMKNWEEDDNEKNCSVKEDLYFAKKVCKKLKIPLRLMNFSSEYWDNVFTKFLCEYRKGKTPNPDVLCNKEIKFKTFFKFAREKMHADYIATGHYVQTEIDKKDGKYQLLCGIDNKKDQSYFLYTISHKRLKYCLFPVGKLTKNKVRKIATELDLPNANKKSSVGICFIGKKKFRNFISQYIPKSTGKIVSSDGIEIGEHSGSVYYTLGQRKGLKIGGIKNKLEKPWYVIEKNIDKNILIVSQNPKHPKLLSKNFIVKKLHWVKRTPLIRNVFCVVKVRYNYPKICCELVPLSEKYVQVLLKEPIASITPGQSAVFYTSSNCCLGGGIIESYKNL